jgi:hypothetical protein
MDECDLEPKEALPRRLVDQVGPFGREPPELLEDILDLVGDVVHARAAVCEEPADGRLLTEGGKQLDPARTDEHRCGLDTLFLDTGPVLELGAEQALVRVDRVVQVVNGDAEMMDAADAHGYRCYWRLLLGESAHGADRLGRAGLRPDVAEQLVQLLAVQRFALEQLSREPVE